MNKTNKIRLTVTLNTSEGNVYSSIADNIQRKVSFKYDHVDKKGRAGIVQPDILKGPAQEESFKRLYVVQELMKLKGSISLDPRDKETVDLTIEILGQKGEDPLKNNVNIMIMHIFVWKLYRDMVDRICSSGK